MDGMNMAMLLLVQKYSLCLWAPPQLNSQWSSAETMQRLSEGQCQKDIGLDTPMGSRGSQHSHYFWYCSLGAGSMLLEYWRELKFRVLVKIKKWLHLYSLYVRDWNTWQSSTVTFLFILMACCFSRLSPGFAEELQYNLLKSQWSSI